MPKNNEPPEVLLARIDERVKKIDECLSNHLKHHWAITCGIIVAAAGAVVSAFIAVMSRLL